MIKVTQGLKDEHSASQKGQVYIFIVAANELALANHYTGLKIDTGAKEPNSWINEKLESITKPYTGQFWDEKYNGYNVILEKCKAAKQDIIDQKYTPAVSEFLDSALMSHVPKAELAGQSSPLKAKTLSRVLEKEREEERPNFVEESKTAKDVIKNRLLEDEFDEEINELKDVDLSLLEREDFEEEEEMEEELPENLGDLLN